MCACPTVPHEGLVDAVIAVSDPNDWGSHMIDEIAVAIVCGVHYRKILIVKYELIDPCDVLFDARMYFAGFVPNPQPSAVTIEELPEVEPPLSVESCTIYTILQP